MVTNYFCCRKELVDEGVDEGASRFMQVNIGKLIGDNHFDTLLHTHLRCSCLAVHNRPDGKHRFPGIAQGLGAGVCMCGVDDHHHADAVVKGAVHLHVVNARSGL